MRITDRIMQNNSLYNINNNKSAENDIMTQISTGKKITRPSDDPTIAIRSLRLRSTVTQLEQYYSKNAEDAKQWLNVTQGALSTVNEVLTSMLKQAGKGPNQYYKLEDLTTLITEMETLCDEYYSTGNLDYAGRSVFTGYRVDQSLTYMEDTTASYKELQDESNGSDVDTSSRVTNMYKLADEDSWERESDVTEYTVGRVRLSYDNIDAAADGDDGTATNAALKYRTEMTVSGSAKISTTQTDTVDMTYTDKEGKSHTLHIPTTQNGSDAAQLTMTAADGTVIRYSATGDSRSGYTVNVEATGSDGTQKYSETLTLNKNGTLITSMPQDGIKSASTSVSRSSISEVTFTAESGAGTTVSVPLSVASDEPYEIAVSSEAGEDYIVTVNTDGTYTLRSEAPATATVPQNVVQITAGGSVQASYLEYSITPSKVITASTSEADIDAIYKELAESTDDTACVLNAVTGELLLSNPLKEKLESLPDLTNANTIQAVYDKTTWKAGDTRPENLFACKKDGITYNGGNSGHISAYDVGYNQSIEVNTTADEVFTTSVKRDVQDLRRMLTTMTDLESRKSVLETKLDAASSDADKEKIQMEIDATKKAYDYMAENIKDEFGHKITSLQKALDMANVAVTRNGTRSRRLDLVQSRLQDQLATFQELQSDNEDVDLAEAATNLSTAELTYTASLQATAKVMKTSLMDYI